MYQHSDDLMNSQEASTTPRLRCSTGTSLLQSKSQTHPGFKEYRYHMYQPKIVEKDNNAKHLIQRPNGKTKPQQLPLQSNRALFTCNQQQDFPNIYTRNQVSPYPNLPFVFPLQPCTSMTPQNSLNENKNSLGLLTRQSKAVPSARIKTSYPSISKIGKERPVSNPHGNSQLERTHSKTWGTKLQSTTILMNNIHTYSKRMNLDLVSTNRRQHIIPSYIVPCNEIDLTNIPIRPIIETASQNQSVITTMKSEINKYTEPPVTGIPPPHRNLSLLHPSTNQVGYETSLGERDIIDDDETTVLEDSRQFEFSMNTICNLKSSDPPLSTETTSEPIVFSQLPQFISHLLSPQLKISAFPCSQTDALRSPSTTPSPPINDCLSPDVESTDVIPCFTNMGFEWSYFASNQTQTFSPTCSE
eukprot:Ihof_evm8s122 gene=Ihof_evmTU8s122